MGKVHLNIVALLIGSFEADLQISIDYLFVLFQTG